jgi:nucleoid-associated protein YgaU
MENIKQFEKDVNPNNLNLKYVVAHQHNEKFMFPWKVCLYWLIFMGIIFGVLWFGYYKRKELVVTHEVTAGDTLRGLGLHYYGDPSAWHKIFTANRDRLMKNDKKVMVGLVLGEKLKIPMSPLQFAKFQKQLRSCK